jgi:hypothetical protein
VPPDHPKFATALVNGYRRASMAAMKVETSS